MNGSRLENKIALVTGAASGLGLAMATEFINQGAKVAMTDINEAGVKEAAAAFGDKALALAQDVTSEKQWVEILQKIKSHFGGLNILVNNAGIGAAGTVVETTLEDWRKMHEIDLDSVFLGCKYAIPVIAETVKDGGRGAVLNLSSIAGVVASYNLASYNSAKAAVRHLSKSVALYCTKEKLPITCNSLHPAFINTPILDGMAPAGAPRDAVLDKLGRQIPMGHVGEPADVAMAAVYLCSDESKFVTGTELYIDGGLSAL
jgi:NAD(P)-dependent dehydrogenase (short-subunit alcohol dehydrogenase family)